MATGYYEFVHICQFYETIMLIILLIPLAAYVLILRHQVWEYINRKRIRESEEYFTKEEEQPDSEIQRQIESI